jgi:hypothetical protein
MEDSVASPLSDAVERRVARLEAETRRLRWVTAAALVGGACALVVPWVPRSAPDTIAASRFVVRDERGRERAFLGFDHPAAARHSPVRLGLYNPDDGSTVVVWVSGAFAGVVASARAADGAAVRAEAFANPREGSGVRLAGPGRRAPATLRAHAGAGELVLEDAGGNVAFRAPRPAQDAGL